MGEPGVFGLPFVEFPIRREFRMCFEEAEEGTRRSGNEIEEAFSKEPVKALRSADRPGIVGEVGIGRGTSSEKVVELWRSLAWRRWWRAL